MLLTWINGCGGDDRSETLYQRKSVLLWIILLSIPTGAGMLFLHPYQEAAWAAFYRDISGTAVVRDSVLPEGSLENSNI